MKGGSWETNLNCVVKDEEDEPRTGAGQQLRAQMGCSLAWAGPSDRLGFPEGQVHLGESRVGCQRNKQQLDRAGPHLICTSSEVKGEPLKCFTQSSGIIRFVFQKEQSGRCVENAFKGSRLEAGDLIRG